MSEYRYNLTRDLSDVPDLGRGRLLWIMLNPSTADETLDDPTIRRVKTFTAREGFRRLIVMNLFAQRATEPVNLRLPSDSEWRLNRDVLVDAIERSDRVILAWGTTIPRALRQCADFTKGSITAAAERHSKELWCLGKTKNGSPRHPLYVKGDTPLEVY